MGLVSDYMCAGLPLVCDVGEGKQPGAENR